MIGNKILQIKTISIRVIEKQLRSYPFINSM